MISVLGQIKGGIDTIFVWFKKKCLKGSADKCHLITSSEAPVEIKLSSIIIMSEEKIKLGNLYRQQTRL